MPRLRVGVVATELAGERTGVGRLLAGMLEGVRAGSLDWEWRLLFPGRRFDHPLWADRRFEPVFSAWQGSTVAWEQLYLPWTLRQHRLDLLYSPGYSLPPLASLPGVVSVHDLSFEVLPDEYSFRERWRRRLLARRASAVAARVLVDSELVREQLVRLYGVEEERIGVLPVTLGPGYPPPAAAPEEELALLERHHVRRPYLLQVGTILERRCPELVVQAFAAIAAERPELQLVLAGADRLRDRERLRWLVAESGMGERVVTLGWVEDVVLPALYRNAELSIYLSTYEGYGLPPLESLACRTAVVTSGGLGLDELWPDYPLRCRRLDLAEVLGVLRRALDDRTTRVEAGARGALLVGELTPQRAAETLVAELSRAVAP